MENFASRVWRALNEEVTTTYYSTSQMTAGTFSRGTISNPQVAGAMAATYTSAVKNKAEYVVEYNKIKNFYLADTLIRSMSDDTLTPDIVSGEILKISSPDQQINEELKKLQERFDLDNIVNEFVYDLLGYGEYGLRLEVKNGEGLINIYDDVDQSKLIGFYRQGYPENFMILDPDKREIQIKPAFEFAHFILQSSKIKVDFDSIPLLHQMLKNNPQALKEVKSLPTTIRIGRPLLYGVISKLKELDLLEKIVPAMKLADITAGSIVGVDVPAGFAPADAFNTAREYENLFNQKTSVDSAGNLSAADILTQAGRIKVIPTYGGGKGSLQNIDVRGSTALNDVMSSIRDIRDVICTSIGFPTELLYGGASQSEMLKKYARYLRRIKSIQASIANGVLQIALAHLKNLENTKECTVRDLEVTFLNEIVNIDELEKLEYYDSKIGYMQNQFNFINSIRQDSNYSDVFRVEDIKRWLKNQLDFLTYDDESDNPEKSRAKPSKRFINKDNKDNVTSIPYRASNKIIRD